MKFSSIHFAILYLLAAFTGQVYAADWPTRARTMNRSAFVQEELPLDQGHLNLKWKRFFGERIEVEMEPTVVEDTVFIGIMNGKLYALEKETGATKWVFTASGPITDTPALSYHNDQLRIVFGCLDGKIYCLDARLGNILWTFQTGAPIMSTACVYDNTVFIGSLDRTFYALNFSDGGQIWRAETSGPISCTAALGDVGSDRKGIFFQTGNNVAYAFRTDGTILWTKQMHGAFTKRTYAVYGKGAKGKRVIMFLTRKAGRDYSEPMENLPSELQGIPQNGTTVVAAWDRYYRKYPKRRTLYYFDAVTGADLWQGARYAPLYLPYWGGDSPLVDDKGFAWLAASGSGGDHSLNHDERLWKINLQTGEYTQVAAAEQFKLRFDEVGRGTLVNDKYYQNISEDVGFYDVAKGARNLDIFGNGFGTHRKPLELAELPGTTVFGGWHKHFTRFGSSGPGGFGGAYDATSPLVISGNVAFMTSWGHLYALSSERTQPTREYMALDLDKQHPPAITREQAIQMLSNSIQKIVQENENLNPVSRMWVDTVSSLDDTIIWHTGEVIRTLSQTLDYIGEPLKAELKSFLKKQIQEYIFNTHYYTYQKACIDYDSGEIQDPCDGTGISASWYWNNKNLIAERIYAVFKYAEKAGDWSFIQDNWHFIVQTMYSAIETDWDSEAGFFLWPEWLSGRINFNLQLGAMYALKEMATRVGDSTTHAEAAAYYDRMCSARITWGNYVRGLYDTGGLVRNDYSDWEDWGFEQSVSPMPAGGYLDKDNDYRQPYSITRSGDLVVKFAGTRQCYPFYLVGFHPFYPELNTLVRDHFSDHLGDLMQSIEKYNPWWYLGDYGHQVAVGLHEDDSFSVKLASDMFQAKAYILGFSFEELAPYLPLPFENYDAKDIYRLQNLVALLQADSSSDGGYPPDVTNGDDPVNNDQHQTVNLLANGDFESGGISPWQEMTDAQVSEKGAHSGSYGVHLPSAQKLVQLWIPVSPGKSYVLTGWFKWSAFSGSEWGYDTFGIINSDWETEGNINNLHAIYQKDTWNKLAVSFTPSTNRVQINFGVFGPKETVDMAFDDLMLYEKTDNLPPVANPSLDISSGEAPLSVKFSANSDDPDGAIATYQWDFGDGTVATTSDPSHTFFRSGTYDVCLRVWDDQGASATKNLKVKVLKDNNPIIAITKPLNTEDYVEDDSETSISGSATALPGREVVTLVWDNISLDKAGIAPINPSASLNWNINSIPLKPGRNEILITATDSAGSVCTEQVIVTHPLSAPVISNISVPKQEVSMYEKFEIQFDVESVADNPFFQYDETPPPGVDPQIGITVEGVFTSPSGKILHQPGFFCRKVLRSETGGRAHYEETQQTMWIVRLSPMETGQYSVTLIARDASGTTENPAGIFNALSPRRKGFIRVSSDDPRYFEFTNGKLFFPIGPAWGPDYKVYSGTGLNLERPWMAGIAAYSTNWSRWIRTDKKMGNEGFESPLTFFEHYPTHELSREISYSQGHRILMGLWGDEEFFPDLKPFTDYLIKLRLKTSGITGPVDPNAPYGFMIKTHGFPTETLEKDLRTYVSMIPVISQNRDWHTVVVKYKTTQQDGLNQYISLYLDNITSGKVFIDQFSIKEILPDSSYGGELIRHSKADIHNYVEQRPAAYFDWQVQQGEENDVYFKYVVQDKNDWIPLHLKGVGVFQEEGDGYFQEDGTKAKWLQNQWWRYIIARWGYSTAVHSWELCNEADPNDKAVYRHTQDFAKFMHQNDSHPHLATTSFWCCWIPDFWGDRTQYPDVDYADLHQYTKESKLGRDMVEWMGSLGHTINSNPANIPVILGETGIGEPGTIYFEALKQANTGIWYHNILWAQLNSGSVITSPNYWWNEHFKSINRQQISMPFYNFVSRLDINLGGYEDLSATSTNPGIRVFGQKNLTRNKAYCWIQNRNHNWYNVMGLQECDTIEPQSGAVTFQMKPNTNYQVEQFNTYTGAIETTNDIMSDARGDITISAFGLSDDFAVTINGPGYSPPQIPQNLQFVH
ncbi:exported hypothetical protein [uncultured Desulfobacterium sp.]|uniref:PKD domain-containing protein n=1 Tax=uncultured Desulfobacterium sp. TaxID=201089 RepID=A0A445N3X7_9BACT|nr:exported hypothetical protein [uncultured Desulfobacterium sp.]